MPNGGKLTLSATVQAGTVLISVTDTGVGIAEEIKPNLFKPMFTTKAKGQGLGLAVVKRLVEALGGSISVESQVGKKAQNSLFRCRSPANSVALSKGGGGAAEVCGALLFAVSTAITHKSPRSPSTHDL